jgi:FkbM family methyltransferase
MARKLHFFLGAMLGSQYIDQPIGKVSIPFLAKPYLRRSFSQQGEDLVLDRIITRVLNWNINVPRYYLDIGAYHPLDHSVTYLLYRRGWHGIAFDPSRPTHEAFKSWRKRDQFVRAVVGDVDGVEVDFFTPKSGGEMSLINTKYPSAEINYESSKSFQVNLCSELERRGVPKIDLMNIDVEGAELEILETFDFERYKPSVIAIEIHGNDIVKCLESDVATLLIRKGYRLVACSVITYFFVKYESGLVL